MGELRQFPRIYSRHSHIGVIRVEEIPDFAKAILLRAAGVHKITYWDENISVKNTDTNVVHNQDSHRFELTVDGHQAVLDYILKDNRIIFTHTRVPSAIEGNGLGSKLVETGLDYARENGLKVKSTCWFVSKYIRLHPEQ